MVHKHNYFLLLPMPLLCSLAVLFYYYYYYHYFFPYFIFLCFVRMCLCLCVFVLVYELQNFGISYYAKPKFFLQCWIGQEAETKITTAAAVSLSTTSIHTFHLMVVEIHPTSMRIAG